MHKKIKKALLKEARDILDYFKYSYHDDFKHGLNAGEGEILRREWLLKEKIFKKIRE